MEKKILAGISKEKFAKLAKELKPGMTDEELKEICKSNEFEPTEEQLAYIKKLVSDSTMLSDDALSNVSGGCETFCLWTST